MIEYVEIRGADTRIIGIIDTASAIIWHSVYFGVGDFEIHTAATSEFVDLLKIGRYITRPDDDEVGIIEKIEITESAEDGATLTASGRFAKSLLERRLIYNLSGTTNTATILRGNVEKAVRKVVEANAIRCEFDDKRNMSILELNSAKGFPQVIVSEDGKTAEKQVSYGNVLTYTDGVLEEYGLSAKCLLNGEKFLYTIYAGIDRSINNTAGNVPLIFSKEYDNLTTSDYVYNTSTEKNVALIGGEGEGLERFYSLIGGNNAGLNRREVFIDASSINKTYKDENDVEQAYTVEEYKTLLDAKGKQDLAPLVVTETFEGTVDTTNGNYFYKNDFELGDIVTVQSNDINVYVNSRICEILESQDSSGYSAEIKFE